MEDCFSKPDYPKKIFRILFNKYFFLLLFFAAVGLIIRTIHLWNNVFFGYDQARDLQRIYDIVTLHKLKLVGPETDIPGVFSGPFYYYLLLPLYYFSHFNPNVASIGLVLLNITGIFFIYITTISIFQSKKAGLIAGLLWSFSYMQANFAKYISNVSPIPITCLIFFMGLSLFFLELV